jgi:hypothetical protein
MSIETSLSCSGYKIKKKHLKPSQIKEIKKDLIVNPFTYGDFGEKNEKKFSLFMESPTSLYLPRFYGQDNYGEPTNNKIEDGQPIDIKFKGSLRKEQEPIVKLYQEAALKNGALGTGISGSGPSVFSLCKSHSTATKVEKAIRQAYTKQTIAFEVYVSKINRDGIRKLN